MIPGQSCAFKKALTEPRVGTKGRGGDVPRRTERRQSVGTSELLDAQEPALFGHSLGLGEEENVNTEQKKTGEASI